MLGGHAADPAFLEDTVNTLVSSARLVVPLFHQ